MSDKMKTCSKCQVNKTNKEFSKCASNKDGLQNNCKTCKKVIETNYAKSWGAGVYQLINENTGDIYIGSSTRLRKRIKDWLSTTPKRIKHFSSNPKLLNDLVENKFSYKILETVENISNLLNIEKEYIQKLQPQYNILMFNKK